jgi:hypothetical protein
MRLWTLAAITSFAVLGWLLLLMVAALLMVFCSFAGRHLLLHVRVETRHVHAERLLAKAGVARRNGEGSPHPWSEMEWSGKDGAQRRSAQAQRGRLGKPLAPRDRGRAP